MIQSTRGGDRGFVPPRSVELFGDLVRTHRQRLSLTQEELAGRTGLSVRGIGKLETGQIANPRASTVRLLAEVFQLSEADRGCFRLAATAGTTAGAAQPPAVPAQAPAPGRSADGRTPAQLPPDVAAFTGRERQLAYLEAWADGTDQSTAVATVLSGMAGVGKTALAVHWGHRAAGRFPDGHLYVNLRGFDPAARPVRPAEVVRWFLEALDVPASRMPTSLAARVGQYRSLMTGRRMLVVLDNVRDAEQVRPLLPGSPTCQAVVTSRDLLTGLAVEGARTLRLETFTADEAWRLLAHRLGAERVEGEPKAVEEIIAYCSRLPLALAITAARAADQPDFPLQTFADELSQVPHRLDALRSGDPATDVRAAFACSYRSLSPAAARLFRLLGRQPAAGVTTGAGVAAAAGVTASAAASLAGEPVARVRPLLAELVRAHLLARPVPGRYALHELLRSYACELADAHGRDPADPDPRSVTSPQLVAPVRAATTFRPPRYAVRP